MIKIIFYVIGEKERNTNMQLRTIRPSSRMTQPNAITTIQQSDMETCDDDMVFTALIKKKIRKYVMI